MSQILAKSPMTDLGNRDRSFGNTQSPDATIDIIKTVPINLNGLTLPWPLYSKKVSKSSLQRHFTDNEPQQVLDILPALLAPESLENPFGSNPCKEVVAGRMHTV